MTSDTVSHSLKDQFLIAMPSMESSGFSQTVTYLCEHDEEGAMGLVINRPTEIFLGEVLSQLDIDTGDEPDRHSPVYAGGPVQTDRGFILHTDPRPWDSTIKITDSISLTTSRDILASIAAHDGPRDCLVALGYASWGAGQLEQELSNNYWLTVSASSDIIFNTPSERRLDAAAGLLGIELSQVSRDSGHA